MCCLCTFFVRFCFGIFSSVSVGCCGVFLVLGKCFVVGFLSWVLPCLSHTARLKRCVFARGFLGWRNQEGFFLLGRLGVEFLVFW